MNMRARTGVRLAMVAALILFGAASQALATIDGLTGSTFDFTAREDFIQTPDGNTLTIWGYANGGGRAQYPGPTLIVNQGDLVTINLTNQLSVPVSIVFPGQSSVTATGGSAGLMTQEAGPGGVDTVSYQFVAAEAGTYLYNSGTQIDLQVEMGLVGALIVRPGLGADHAYNHADTQFDHEYLFLLSEMDPVIHDLVEFGRSNEVDMAAYRPRYWFINGRSAPDTLFPAYAGWLPTQPYNCLPRLRPGEKLLMRVIGGGRDLHPYHHHGNHARVIAHDGRMLSSGEPGAGADLSYEVFTIPTVPGETYDALFGWTGKGMGWDIYGHASGDALEPNEYAPDHGKPLPVELPQALNLTYGGFYSGSPFLGAEGGLPPGEGGLNLNGGFFFMWHSHTEMEMQNFDIFPGGMMTMFVVEPWSVAIP
jgi:FtsP/CotA-like multicopper oxidase with cupredoxin domain